MYTVDDIKKRVTALAEDYNESADDGKKITRIELFGSYAKNAQNEDSDVDFLVAFLSKSVGILTLAQVLTLLEEAFDCPVDMVKLPIPEGSFLQIERTVPLYEAA